MQILAKKLNEINPYPGNPRKNTQAVDAVAASIKEFGFDEDEDFKDLTEEVEDDEFEIKPPQKPKAQKGDLFILGSHVLMCGDSTDENDVDKLMDGNEADLVVTDPPYNNAVKNSKGMTIKNDDMKRDDFLMFLKKLLRR